MFRSFINDDFVAVYDAQTGDTHLFNVLSCELLRLLEVSPATMDELKSRVLLEFSQDEPAVVLDAVDLAIADLQRCNLVFSGLN